MASSYKRIASVEKACSILDVVAHTKEPITGNEVATRVQLPDGTVMCLLATLQDAGLVQEVGGGWRLGMRMGVYWARIRATMEAERDRLNQNIREIGGE
jgi:DNA-binding IclR family transcriptional regulator